MQRAFTITELLIGMLVSSILVLTIVVMSTSAVSSHHYLSKEAEAYNDLYYGVDFIERGIRRAQQVGVDTAQNTISADNLVFKLDQGNLVCIDNSVSPAKISIIINGSKVSNLQFIPGEPGVNSYTALISDTVTLAGGKTANLTVNLNVTGRN